MVFDSTNAYFVGVWSPFNSFGYIAVSPLSALEDGPFLELASSTIFVKTTQYSITVNTVGTDTLTTGSFTTQSGSAESLIGYIDRIYYFPQSVKQTGLIKAMDYSLTPLLTCSSFETNSLNYGLGSYNGSSNPIWASYDTTFDLVHVSNHLTAGNNNVVFGLTATLGSEVFNSKVQLQFQDTCDVQYCLVCTTDGSNL